MPRYKLRIVEKLEDLDESANDISHALEIFGKRLGVRLTLEDQGAVAEYLLDEWNEEPHWADPHIPVYTMPDRSFVASRRNRHA